MRGNTAAGAVVYRAAIASLVQPGNTKGALVRGTRRAMIAGLVLAVKPDSSAAATTEVFV